MGGVGYQFPHRHGNRLRPYRPDRRHLFFGRIDTDRLAGHLDDHIITDGSANRPRGVAIGIRIQGMASRFVANMQMKQAGPGFPAADGAVGKFFRCNGQGRMVVFRPPGAVRRDGDDQRFPLRLYPGDGRRDHPGKLSKAASMAVPSLSTISPIWSAVTIKGGASST